MASLDRLEGDLAEGTGWLVVILLVALVILGYLAWKDIAIPTSWYPDQVWGRFASWVDEVFSITPISGGNLQHVTDDRLASIFGWINQNLPQSTSSKGWSDYASQYEGEPSSSIATGDGMGGDSTVTTGGFAETQSDVLDYQIPDEQLGQLDLQQEG